MVFIILYGKLRLHVHVCAQYNFLHDIIMMNEISQLLTPV